MASKNAQEDNDEQAARWRRGAIHGSLELVEDDLPGEAQEGMRRYRVHREHSIPVPYTTHSPEEFKES